MDSFTYTITLIVGIFFGVVSIALIAGAVYAIGIWYPRQVAKEEAALKASGRQGEATILRLPRSDMRSMGRDALYTGVTIGLEIRVPGVETYEIDKYFMLPTSSLRDLKIGKIVPVWIDPDNPRNPDKIVIHVE